MRHTESMPKRNVCPGSHIQQEVFLSNEICLQNQAEFQKSSTSIRDEKQTPTNTAKIVVEDDKEDSVDDFMRTISAGEDDNANDPIQNFKERDDSSNSDCNMYNCEKAPFLALVSSNHQLNPREKPLLII